MSEINCDTFIRFCLGIEHHFSCFCSNGMHTTVKENILPPSTIDGYRKIKKNSLSSICDLFLNEITTQDIRSLVNYLCLMKQE